MNASYFTVSHPLSEIYYREIKAYPSLTTEEEIVLAEQMRGGDPEARQQLINANLLLVVRIACIALPKGGELMDLIQEGNIGLIRAVDKFDPTRGARFSTHAMYWIKKQIQLYQHHNYDDTLSLDIEITTGDEYLCLSDTIEDGDTLLGSPSFLQIDTILEREELHGQINEQVAALPANEREVLQLLYGTESRNSYSITEVAVMLRISKVRVCQLRDRALRKIRRTCGWWKGEQPLGDSAN